MRRREFVGLIGAAAAWPLTGRAQQRARPIVGYVGAQSRTFYASRLRSFHAGLVESEFEDGRNVALEYRWAENHPERLPALLSDLVAQRVDVIVLPDSTAGAIAAKKLISTIPIVFGIAGGPVELGLVESWNRPGGNLTGIVLGNAELVPRRMELLHQLAPMADTIGLLINPKSSGEFDRKFGEDAARTLGLRLHILNASSKDDITTAIGELAKEARSALLVGSDTLFYTQREWITGLANKHALVTIYDRREYVQVGGLISYGASLLAFHRQLGVYVGRILKGEKPADLPVTLPTKFDLAVNVKTAKRLGVAIPVSMLATADEVIE